MNLCKEGFQHLLQPVERDKAVFKEEGYRAVSYTHLDVYKRQVMLNFLMRKERSVMEFWDTV